MSAQLYIPTNHPTRAPAPTHSAKNSIVRRYAFWCLRSIGHKRDIQNLRHHLGSPSVPLNRNRGGRKKSLIVWQRPAETPDPDAPALPAARPVSLRLSISETVENQHRNIGLGSAATAGAIAIETLAVIQEVAEGNQSRGVGVHGRSMVPSVAHCVGLHNWREPGVIRLPWLRQRWGG